MGLKAAYISAFRPIGPGGPEVGVALVLFSEVARPLSPPAPYLRFIYVPLTV
jgi:hypothetical protein